LRRLKPSSRSELLIIHLLCSQWPRPHGLQRHCGFRGGDWAAARFIPGHAKIS
jgi:hypothetical protein